MLVRIWGCRGSIPVATNTTILQGKLTQALLASSSKTFDGEKDIKHFLENELPWPVSHSFGGNTSCVEIETGTNSYTLCDLGTGVREFGRKMLETHGPASPQTYNIFMSHLHWDHVMGFPFFIPSYIPGNQINIYSCHSDAEMAFKNQHSEPGFPVDFSALGASINFHTVRPNQPFEVDGTTITAVQQYHGGESYGYRFDRNGKSVVYSTDSEHKQENQDEMAIFVELFKEADLVIFDAQYSLAEMQTLKEDWGHSSNIIGVELCTAANAKHLVLFHHEPSSDDETLYKIFQETIRYEEIVREGSAMKISAAFDGLEIEI